MNTVLHIIGSLGVGGAEKMLLKEVQEFRNVNHIIWNISGRCSLPTNRSNNLVIYNSLDVRILSAFFRRDTIIKGWLYHGSLIASIIGVLFRRKVVWAIRQSYYDTYLSLTTKLVVYSLRFISFQPNAIYFNSYRSKEEHTRFGFRNMSMLIQKNIINIDSFSVRKKSCSKQFNIEELAIAFVGRNHKVKNFEGFLQIYKIIHSRFPEVMFNVYGRGYSSYYNKFKQVVFHGELSSHELKEQLSKNDVLFCTSTSESMPNSVIEGILSALVVYSTDVGDVSLILDDSFILEDYRSFSLSAMVEMLENAKIQNVVSNNLKKLESYLSECDMDKFYKSL